MSAIPAPRSPIERTASPRPDSGTGLLAMQLMFVYARSQRAYSKPLGLKDAGPSVIKLCNRPFPGFRPRRRRRPRPSPMLAAVAIVVVVLVPVIVLLLVVKNCPSLQTE